MISYNDALLKSAYFSDICVSSASILRYYQVGEIIKMLDNARRLEAEMLSELSSLTAEMRLSADIVTKEQEEELFPLLSDILKKIRSSASAASQCYKVAGAANTRAEAIIKDRVNVSESSAIGDYVSAASPYQKEPMIRDAIGAIKISEKLNAFCSSRNGVSEDIIKLESIKPKFMYRHYNILLKIKKAMDTKLSLIDEISSIIDACTVSVAVVNSLGGHNKTVINNFLNNDISTIIDNMSRIYISSLKGE